jgi:hypothetical protein
MRRPACVSLAAARTLHISPGAGVRVLPHSSRAGAALFHDHDAVWLFTPALARDRLCPRPRLFSLVPEAVWARSRSHPATVKRGRAAPAPCPAAPAFQRAGARPHSCVADLGGAASGRRLDRGRARARWQRRTLSSATPAAAFRLRPRAFLTARATVLEGSRARQRCACACTEAFLHVVVV